MKMVKKLAALAAVALLALGSAAASDMGMYAKLGLGYANWHIGSGDYKDDCGHFSIKPVFGITKVIPQVKELSFEAFLDIDFGSTDIHSVTVDTRVITPGARAIWSFPLAEMTGNKSLEKLVPYAGAGFCTAIVHWEYSETFVIPGYGSYRVSDDATKTYFELDTLAGCRYDISDKIGAGAELGMRYGNAFNWSLTAALTYNIK